MSFSLPAPYRPRINSLLHPILGSKCKLDTRETALRALNIGWTARFLVSCVLAPPLYILFTKLARAFDSQTLFYAGLFGSWLCLYYWIRSAHLHPGVARSAVLAFALLAAMFLSVFVFFTVWQAASR